MRSALLRAVQLPLLMIELRQLAAAGRTYVIRFVYAATLFGVACWLFYGADAGDTPVLGRGLELFRQLVLVQFWGLCVVIPATTCGVIAEEKGRDTLGILLLSPLGSIRITTQKLLSRILPMVSFVLLSLPLLAVAYAYGGVSNAELFLGVVLLLLTAAQIGSLSLLMSVWMRTTMEAMVVTYVVFLVTVFSCIWVWPIYYVNDVGLSAFPFVSSFLFTGGCVVLAALSLVSRAFQSTQNYLLQLQRSLDLLVADANRLVGGVRILKPEDSRPKNNPVAWRETERRSLGKLRYLIRVLFLIELPLICLACLVATRVGLAHSLLRSVLWVVAALLIGTHGAGLIAGERSRNTLDVLLTTPLSGRTILLEKGSGLRRVIVLFVVPLVTLFAIEAFRARMRGYDFALRMGDFVWSCASAVIWLVAVAWFALFVSTRIRNQTRASLVVVSTLATVTLVPVLVAAVLKTGGASDAVIRSIALVSPTQIQATLSPYTQAAFQLPRIPVWILVLHFTGAGLLAYALRRLSFRQIDETLGRIPENFVLDERHAPPEALATREPV